MRSFRAGRATRRVMLVAAVSFVVTSVAVGVTSHGTTEPAPAPEEVTLNAALAAFTTSTAYFLNVPGIPGESLQKGFENQIELRAATWGLTNPPGTPSGAQFENVLVTKGMDASSPLLMKAGAAGSNLGTVVLTGLKAGTTPRIFVTLTLTSAKVRSFHDAAALTTGVSESVGFSFGTIKLTYNKQNASGTITPITGCWNLVTHVAC